MPLILLILGAVMVITAARGTQGELGKQLASDFKGSANFLDFFGIIILVGMLGYIPELKKFAVAMIALVLLSAILLHNKIFDQVSQVANNAPKSLQEIPLPQPSSGGSGSSLGTLALLGA